MSAAHDHTHPQLADVSVRPSVPEDAEHLGRIQVAAWQRAFAEVLPASALSSLDTDDFAETWRSAILSPPSAKHRMLTACAGAAVVGFAALAPASQSRETGEIVALEVDPQQARQGHGSRLLAACTDILKETSASHVRAWAVEGDQTREDFLAAAGLEPLGIRRVLEIAGVHIGEDAWSALL